jgi:hypothetical protein
MSKASKQIQNIGPHTKGFKIEKLVYRFFEIGTFNSRLPKTKLTTLKKALSISCCKLSRKIGALHVQHAQQDPNLIP